jgi:prepilin signal peptidase PulO-like enzyme (type II secretory pathway)
VAWRSAPSRCRAAVLPALVAALLALTLIDWDTTLLPDA